MMSTTFAERCAISEQCLPAAPYRDMLSRLHADMLSEIERLKQHAGYWENDAKRYASNADYWRDKALAWASEMEALRAIASEHRDGRLSALEEIETLRVKWEKTNE